MIYSKIVRHLSTGFSLLEVLIAGAISALILIIGFSVVWPLSAFNPSHETAQNNAIELTFARMRWAIEHSGFIPLRLNAATTGAETFSARYGAPLLWCPSGLENTSAVNARCATATSGGGATLIIRFVVDPSSVTTTSDGRPQDCLGNGIPAQDNGDYLFEARYSVRTNGATGQKELYCQGSGRSDPSRNFLGAQPILTGVESFEIFALFDSNLDGILDQELTAFDPNNPPEVIRLCLQIRANRLIRARTAKINCAGNPISSAASMFYWHYARRSLS